MIRFSPDFIENFLAVVRKYMQIRGGLTQKDLSEKMNVSHSTINRFLNLKTNNVDEQLVANIIATLEIPLHEIIDWVAEESTDTLRRLVQFYKDQTKPSDEKGEDFGNRSKPTAGTINVGSKPIDMSFGAESTKPMTGTPQGQLSDKIKTLTLRQRGYINEFLSLESNDRDLVVDVSAVLITYLKKRDEKF